MANKGTMKIEVVTAEPGENIVIDAGSIGSLVSISEQPAMLESLSYSNMVVNTNLSMQNAVSNQQSSNQIRTATLGKAVNMVSNLGPLAGKSSLEVLTGNAVAEEILDLKAAIAGLSDDSKRRKPLKPLEPVLPPFPIDFTPVFAEAPVVFRFIGVNDPDDLKVTPESGGASVTG